MKRQKNLQRLFVLSALAKGTVIACDKAQVNYLAKVLRMKEGDQLYLFNGHDGQWLASFAPRGRSKADLIVTEQTHPQSPPGHIHLVFAPLKKGRLDYMMQKAAEMGAGHITPVKTDFTVPDKFNHERAKANLIEGAEQCGILSIPQLGAFQKLEDVINSWPSDCPLVFADEDADIKNPVEALLKLKEKEFEKIGLLIGPEGGFSDQERAMVRALKYTMPLSLGRRIMRADTAMVAAMALINGVFEPPIS